LPAKICAIDFFYRLLFDVLHALKEHMAEHDLLPSSKWLSTRDAGSPTFFSRISGSPSPLFERLLGRQSISNSKEAIQEEIAEHVNHLGLTDSISLDNEAAYQAAALT
jgi:hypothetical protein